MKLNKDKPQKTGYSAKFLKFIIILTVSLSLNGYSQKTLSKIAFGSCGREDHALPIFDVVVKHKPDLFIFLGDNIYGDTKDKIWPPCN